MASEGARGKAVAVWLALISAGVVAWPGRAQGPLLVRYPYLQDVGADHATVLFATRESGGGAIQYSTAGGATTTMRATERRLPDSLTALSVPYYQQEAVLTGLRPAAEYSYRVLLDNRTLAGEDGLRFRTAGPGPFTFLAFGDSGTGGAEQRALAQLMLREQPALVLHTGDIAYPRATFPLLHSRYLDIYQDLMKRVGFFAVAGNHEYEADNAAPFLALHSPPTDGVPAAGRGRYYSFDWGDVHFVGLDTNRPLSQAVEGSGPMLRWLEQDLSRTRRPWRVVFLQHPAYPTSVHENDPVCATVRQRIVPLLERYDVQLVLAGHEHNYQRTRPMRGGQVVGAGPATVHVITGGGGAALYSVVPRVFLEYAESTHHYLRAEVQGPRLTVRAIRIDGQEIDSFTLALPAPPSPPPPPPPPPPPNPVTLDGIVNAASFTPAMAPGSLISIFGRRLATAEGRATRLPLPEQLSGTAVMLNGRRLPLLYVSSTQINAKLRFDVEGAATVRVITPEGFSERPVTILESAPAVFLVGPSPAVARANGELVSQASPAGSGEAVVLYLTGLGRPEGNVVAGDPAPVSPLVLARGPIEVVVSGRSARPLFAGLTPGFAGLYQINFQVPEGLGAGLHELRILARGAISDPVGLPVQPPATGGLPLGFVIMDVPRQRRP